MAKAPTSAEFGKLVPKYRELILAHPDWTLMQVHEEVQRLETETQAQACPQCAGTLDGQLDEHGECEACGWSVGAPDSE